MNSTLIDNRQIRVFISSTFQDMQDERDYLMRRTFPKLRKLAAERDVTLTELDLRWGITEEEAQSGKVVEICLREIENSIPFFIGIIGNRYGWVPRRKDIGANVTDRFRDVEGYLDRGLSVTEMEMQFGVLDRKEDDLHAYFYIKEQEETQDNPEMLNKLKTAVEQSRYPSSKYASPEDLANQVEQAFTALLDELFPQGNLSELEKERIGQRSFMNQLSQTYVRDESNFRVLDEWLGDWSKHQMVVTGESGLGKSALIANWLCEKLQQKERPYRIIYHFVGNGGSLSSKEHLINVLCSEIYDQYGWTDDDPLSNDEEELNNLFLRIAANGRPLLIVIDGINQLTDIENSKLLNWLPAPCRNTKMLFSTLEGDRTMGVFRQRRYPVFTLMPLDEVRRRQLIKDYLWISYSKKLSDPQIDRIVSDPQNTNTLVLRTLLDELVGFSNFEQLDERIDYFLRHDSIESFYQAVLLMYENEFGFEIVRHLLTLLSVSKNGLTEDELLTVAGSLKRLTWSEFYCSFGAHLVMKNGLISFSHQYMRQAIDSRYQTASDCVCRREIASGFCSRTDHRAWEELAYQYDHLQDYEALYRLLIQLPVFDYFFEHSRFELGGYWRHLNASGRNYRILDYSKHCSEAEALTLTKVAFFCEHELCDYQYTIPIARKALNLGERIGSLHVVAESITVLGSAYDRMGNAKKAIECHKRDLELEICQHGKTHLFVANAYSDLSIDYQSIGDLKNAFRYANLSLAMLQHFDLPDRMAIAYNNIALLYKDKGDYESAIAYMQKAIELNIRTLGPSHREVGVNYSNLSHIYISLGRYNLAESYAFKAKEIALAVNGFVNKDYLCANGMLASIYQDARRFDEALRCRQENVEIVERMSGEYSAMAATEYHNLGVLLDRMGEHDNGAEYMLRAMNIREELLPADHPEIAQSYTSVGAVYGDKGDYGKELEYLQKSLQILTSLYGNNHEDVALAYANLREAYLSLGQQEQALKCGWKAFRIRRCILGQKNQSTINSLAKIGLVYEEQSIGKALFYLRKALALQKEAHGCTNMQYLKICNHIHLIYYGAEKYQQAYDYALRVYRLSRRLKLRNYHYAYNLADCCFYLGDYRSAARYYRESLISMEDDPERLPTMKDLAYCYRRLHQWKKGMEVYGHILRLAEREQSDQLKAEAYDLMAYLYVDKRDYKQSIACLINELSCYEEEQCVEKAQTLRFISALYRRLRQHEQSVDYCRKALAMIAADGSEEAEKARAHIRLTEGLTWLEMGQPTHARDSFLASKAIRKKYFEPNSPQMTEVEELLSRL